MTEPDEGIDWERCTWQGARRAQVRAYLKLTVRERLEAVERMGQMARALQAMRQKRGAGSGLAFGHDFPPSE